MYRSFRYVLSMVFTTFLAMGILTPVEAQSNPQGGGYWLQESKVKQAAQLMQQGKSIEGAGVRPAQPQASQGYKTLQEMRKEDQNSSVSYQSQPGAPQLTAEGWSPPKFEYDYITTTDECRQNKASGSETGWIKNHYAFCWSHGATYQVPRKCYLGICSYDGVQFQFTEIGYGSNHDRKMRVVYYLDDILITNPALNGAKLKIDFSCDSKINPGDCKEDPDTPAVERTIAQWKNNNYGIKNFLSDAPPADDNNPDRIGYMEFWPKLTVTHAPRKFKKSIDGIKQTVRFDSATYMFAFPDQYFRNGAIFSKTDAVLKVPITDPDFSILEEAGEHWKFAMDHPEQTIPTVLGKKIPGALGDRPLTRLYTRRHPEEYAKNRNKTRSTCDREFKNEDLTGKQCDEFPFASTWEGSAMNGQDWFSIRLISADSNQAAGSWLGSWYAYDRILDRDPFYVEVEAPVEVASIRSEGAPQDGQDHRSSGNFKIDNIPPYATKLKWTITDGPADAHFDVMHDDSFGIDETIFYDLHNGSITEIKKSDDLYTANPTNTGGKSFTVHVTAIP
ncbi:hypothetical protein QF028_002615 [Neobacillus sp. B4I6]|uniref:NucA/NucB deoxyribonuclease domain-containing protein n=1 Tax=Neobacillus sp. B4I6 TaxID=3373925 RepID=UPI003D1A9B85